jgi:hypothetical protein
MLLLLSVQVWHRLSLRGFTRLVLGLRVNALETPTKLRSRHTSPASAVSLCCPQHMATLCTMMLATQQATLDLLNLGPRMHM